MTWYVVDGMDGCGKSSVAQLLEKKLESDGRSVLVYSHPTERLVGRIERRTLQIEGKAAHITSTVLYVMDVVSSLVRFGFKRRRYDDAIFVRYSLGVCYLPEKLVPKGYRIISAVFPEPDVKILVDIDENTAMGRIRARGEPFESFEKEEELAAIRRRLLSVSGDGWHIVDNSGTWADTERQISELLSRLRYQPISLSGTSVQDPDGDRILERAARSRNSGS